MTMSVSHSCSSSRFERHGSSIGPPVHHTYRLLRPASCKLGKQTEVLQKDVLDEPIDALLRDLRASQCFISGPEKAAHLEERGEPVLQSAEWRSLLRAPIPCEVQYDAPPHVATFLA